MAKCARDVLIRRAEVWRRGLADVRLAHGQVAAVGNLEPETNEEVIEARGGALLPGLHDHHLHLAGLAAARSSVRCGPPEITDEAALAAALARPGSGWLRGIGYHESVAGMLDARKLDRWVPDRPVRIQHRSGRMWFLNTPAVELLLERAAAPPSLDRRNGQLFDEDRWLRETLGSTPPPFAEVSRELAACGVTGLTDMSPSNDTATAEHFAAERLAERLLQQVVLAGTIQLGAEPLPAGIRLGPAKLHLHDAALPDPDEATRFVAAAHRQDRAVAVHCTTEGELVFALAALAAAGSRRDDRIEHASVAPDHLIEEIARLGLQVVSQPHFIAERGDRYLRDVEPRDRPFLYRLAAIRRAGIGLAAGSDAPFGSHDPWAAMRAAVSRRTAAGEAIGEAEALTPETALGLYLGEPHDLTDERRIAPHAPADLCLLDRPWAQARSRLLAGDLRLVLIAGAVVHQRVDETPGQRSPRGDPPAR